MDRKRAHQLVRCCVDRRHSLGFSTSTKLVLATTLQRTSEAFLSRESVSLQLLDLDPPFKEHGLLYPTYL